MSGLAAEKAGKGLQCSADRLVALGRIAVVTGPHGPNLDGSCAPVDMAGSIQFGKVD